MQAAEQLTTVWNRSLVFNRWVYHCFSLTYWHFECHVNSGIRLSHWLRVQETVHLQLNNGQSITQHTSRKLQKITALLVPFSLTKEDLLFKVFNLLQLLAYRWMYPCSIHLCKRFSFKTRRCADTICQSLLIGSMEGSIQRIYRLLQTMNCFCDKCEPFNCSDATPDDKLVDGFFKL